ncbi:MAG: prepilin-type N-terminal cleavage/methylation domain-containing protein [Armatimonadetes bacterium]|nr:prepilin-type N-terminal cleavage/methylation domain-containing protein [Armatimonadota bacterium]
MASRGRKPQLARGRRGITLIELMLSASVLSIILGAVLMLQLQGLKMYKDVAATDWASFDAAVAVGRMEEDIQSCYRVIGRYPDRITLSMPLTYWDASQKAYLPVRPLQTGDAVRYYLSDATGALGRQGSYFWRAVKRPGAQQFVVDPKPMADNIRSLQFSHTMAPAPRQASVAAVWLIVEAEAHEGSTTRYCSHSSSIVLRNVQFGPVSNETGQDT